MTTVPSGDELAFLLKSYRPDLAYARRLVDSFHRFSDGTLTLHILVPSADVPEFTELAGPTVAVEPEESLVGSHLVAESLAGFSPGYINQQIVKLAFWETGRARNYLCLDSDAVFIRPFTRADFMAAPGVPYTFLTEDAELHAEPEYFAEHWITREPKLRRIQHEVGLHAPRILTCHQHAVFSAAVLEAFRDRFLAPRGWGYADALAVSPYEFAWYNMWIQKDQTIPVVVREPVFKTFHNATQHLEYLLMGLSEADVARGYVGLVVNSNYSRGAGIIGLNDPRAESLASYLTGAELLKGAGLAAWRRLERRRTS